MSLTALAERRKMKTDQLVHLEGKDQGGGDELRH
jgi:hypothetical protein